jgi:hypothetical protein
MGLYEAHLNISQKVFVDNGGKLDPQKQKQFLFMEIVLTYQWASWRKSKTVALPGTLNADLDGI